MYFSESLDCWVVDGYADAVDVMRAPALEIPVLPLPVASLNFEEQAALGPLWEQARDTPLYSTGKAHQRLRGELRGPFTQDAVDRRRPMIRQTTDAAIDAGVRRGTLDVVGDLARPLMRHVMADVVGIPATRRAEFDRLATMTMDAGMLATPQRPA
jgi:cytochrome P450